LEQIQVEAAKAAEGIKAGLDAYNSGSYKPETTPANVLESQWFEKLTPEQQEQHLRVKRASPWLNEGNQYAQPSQLPGGQTRTRDINLKPSEELAYKGNAARTTQQAIKDVNLAMDGQIAADVEQKKQNVQLAMEPKRKQAVDEVEQKQAFKAETRKKMSSLQVQNRNLERAIALSKNGANTGWFNNLLPTFQAQTVALEHLQAEMGLDIVGAVTFGALSKGELDIALQTALPTDLSGPELVLWAKQRMQANKKLIGYLTEQINFINSGGTVDEWVGKLEEKTNKGSMAPAMTDEDYQQRKQRLLGQ
jgi:hypothetical protein